MHVMKMLADRAKRNRMIASFIKWSISRGRNVMVMVDTVKHCERIEDACVELGVDMSLVSQYTGGMKKSALANAKKNAQVLICTYKFTAEGTDIPRMDTLVLGTPRSDIEQIAGRVLRLSDGKQKPLILDIVDNRVPLFVGYFKNRLAWYESVGAKRIMSGGS
jgi:superfamily II DNA or RNA helicase